MIAAKSFANETLAVMGLARSGLSSVRALVAGGAKVIAWDDQTERCAVAAEFGAVIEDLSKVDFSGVSRLVLSPGIPHTYPAPHPVTERARAAGVPIIGDIEILLRTCPNAHLIGVTGTNGKSTTTALIGHILEQAGLRCQVGGNIGRPVLEFEEWAEDEIYVLELSSYQLELTPSLSCAVAVLLNVSPDHLDRHGGLKGYVVAKQRIFAGMARGAPAIVGIDDEASVGIHAALPVSGAINAIPISGLTLPKGGVGVERGRLVDARGGRVCDLFDFSRAVRLPGSHNAQNAAAAAVVSLTLGIEPCIVAKAIRDFPGLPHRQELVASERGVSYVNDSKATNADAAARALVCYRPIYWIAGGIAKEGGIDGLAPYFGRIRHAFLIGASMEAFASTLAGRVPFSACVTLDHAVKEAHELAVREGQNGATVLLSPAAASFDQFANYEARGNAFRNLVAFWNSERGTANRRAS
ncbi:MAG: UDP-N-acetylmuramoyl-L-alanine--D-glutamate ligase [Rhodospirillaceae bacterium]|nr:UDP-N-acetylmuramoyl-L-alanine--D-glutamate ligase [Rhodospirillaceae bacterium]